MSQEKSGTISDPKQVEAYKRGFRDGYREALTKVMSQLYDLCPPESWTPCVTYKPRDHVMLDGKEITIIATDKEI